MRRGLSGACTPGCCQTGDDRVAAAKFRAVVTEAPASSANLGPGFDVFAMALAEPTDVVEIEASETPSVKVQLKVKGGRRVPTAARANVAGAVALRMAEDFDLRARITMTLTKGVPIGRGLGSSAASSAAAAFAVNECFGLGLTKQRLVDYAAHGEFVACGTAHRDNVAASLLGGFVMVPRQGSNEFVSFEAPRSLTVCLATPLVPTPKRKTEYARSLVPRTVTLEKVTDNISSAATMAAGFASGDVAMIGRGMTDLIVEPARAKTVPGYAMVKKAALLAGAVGACISGAGPTMLAMVDSEVTAPDVVLKAMVNAFKEAGVAAKGVATRPGKGARLKIGN